MQMSDGNQIAAVEFIQVSKHGQDDYAEVQDEPQDKECVGMIVDAQGAGLSISAELLVFSHTVISMVY